jgi:hypothetical protein
MANVPEWSPPDLAPDRELPASPEGPIPSHTSAVVICRACGEANAAGSNLCRRPTCRKTLRGNGLSREHGLYAGLPAPHEVESEAAGHALVEQSIVDAGGRSELAARELADHQYRGVLHVRILKLSRALEVHGEFDRRGRLRKGWIELLDRLIASAVSIDKTLGMARRPRQLPRTPSEALMQEPKLS